MKSPFPGMDPYLEQRWGDLHTRLVFSACNAIQSQLGHGLRARMEERVFVEDDRDRKREFVPDVMVYEYGLGESYRLSEDPGGVAVAEPLVMKIAGFERRERFIQIIDAASGGNVVTIIEFISPSNKLRGRGRDLYLSKRDEAIGGRVNFVEIDLTRRGSWIFEFPLESLPASHRTPYLAAACRAPDFERHEIYRIPLREPLPSIRIPLRKEDTDIRLDLQQLLDRAYHEGRYDDIDYTRPLDPPLPEEDREWAAALTRDVST